jgi:hypothetical protein
MPSTSLVQQGATALLAAQPQNNQNTPAIISGDVCVGCIVWLPPKASYGNPPVLCNRLCCCGQAALEDRGYDHPVVVLKIRQRVNSSTIGDLVCTVACVGSVYL